MDFTEFRRRLGAEPRSRDPEFLRARDSGTEFREAADAAERFEDLLERVLRTDTPGTLEVELSALPNRHGHGVVAGPRRWAFAMAAGLLVAFGAVFAYRQMYPSWDTVEEYVVDHYHHDGESMLARAQGGSTAEAEQMFRRFGVAAAPELAAMISVVKICPTPDGRGVHMVLNTSRGLVTVIYMPRTGVTDRERLVFDRNEAVLVALASGSAVVIGNEDQDVDAVVSLVEESIRPVSRTG